MQCFISCWRLVDWQKDLASRVSSILMELCKLEVFLLTWPEPSQSASPGSSPGKYSSGRSRSCPCHCIGGHFLWIDWYVNKWEVVFVFWKQLNPYKWYWILQWHPKWKIFTTKKTSLFYPEDGVHKKKLHGLSEEPNPFWKKRQLLAQEQEIFVCLKLLLSVEMNETLSPFEGVQVKTMQKWCFLS